MTIATCMKNERSPSSPVNRRIAVRFTVRPGATVTGRVLTPEGAPAADARVSIVSPL